MKTSTERPATEGRAGLDWSSLTQLRRRFDAVNRERLRRVSLQLSERQQGFLDLLPLLFHTNHPLMPGYVGSDAPAGVAGYQPGEAALSRARQLVRAFTYARRALRDTPVQGIYLMGSTGTIGQSSASDLDIWLCHDPELAPSGVDRLREKAELVGAWADTLGLETHFFPLTAEGLREGRVAALSSESSGSTQHHLLLDEFYRTGLLVAGRAPAWWQVPVEHEHDYDACLEELSVRRLLPPGEYLDFGRVADIPAAEFLGATLWQLFKGIAHPHKSVLKILLLEGYAAEHPRTELLSERYKGLVQEGEESLDALDPYVLLLRKVEHYLATLGDGERLELARCCFYLKANIDLSRQWRQAGDPRARLLQSIVDGWEWPRHRVAGLDARGGWKIDRVMEDQKLVVNALTTSYRRLSAFVRGNAGSATVSNRNLTILGRKLFTVFEHKAGKVDVVNGVLSDDLSETHLSLHQVRPAPNQEYWLLYRGVVQPAGARPQLAVKRAWTLLEAIAWCHFNGLLRPATRVLVSTLDCSVDGRDIEHLGTYLRECFPRGMAAGASVDDLAAPPSLLAASVFVNLDADPLSSYTRQGKHLASAQADALNYSGGHENLVRVVDYMVVTSWREIMTFKFHGMEGLLTCLCEHLRWVNRSSDRLAGTTSCRSFARGQASAITRRVDALFEAVTDWFTAPASQTRRRYVLRGGQRYHTLVANGDVATHDFSGSHAELLRYLGRSSDSFVATAIDPLALSDSPLPAVYAGNRADVVQFHYLPEGDHARVFVLDEFGALFCDSVPFHNQAALLKQYEHFFESVRLRQNTHARAAPAPGAAAWQVIGEPGETHEPPRPQFHVLRKVRGGGYRAVRVEPESGADAAGFLSVEVIADSVGSGTRFTLYVNGREFSTAEYGGSVFRAVAEHIVAQRRAASTYDIYITDIDLTGMRSADDRGAPHTLHYLHYKRRIEERLNRALTETADTPISDAGAA